MPSDRPTAAALPLALAVCVLVVAGVAATPGIAVGQPLTVTAPQDPGVGEAALALDRPTRRLIQQGLRNEGFDPGTPDGLFGPRTRAAIREWQQSRGGSPTGYLNGAEAELLRTAAMPPPAVAENSPLPQAVPAVDPDASSPAAPAASTADADANPKPPVATEADPRNAAATNTGPTSRPALGSGNAQLPPGIMVDRHLVRAERHLADDDPAAAIEAMNEILALHEEHDVVLADDFAFHYAQVALTAGRTQTAITSLNEYLVAAGQEGELYREALELLDSAEVRLEREAADRRRAEAERQRAEADRRRAARWPPGHVFRDCDTCPEMVVLPGSVLALGRYEVTLGEYRTFAAATGRGADSRCYNRFSDSDFHDHSWRNPGFPQTDRHPVTCISWDDAQAYAFGWAGRPARTIVCPLSRHWPERLRVLSLGAAGSVPAAVPPVRSAPMAATDWVCRTWSRAYLSGRRAASATSAAADAFTAVPGATCPLSRFPTGATTSAPTVDPPKSVFALPERGSSFDASVNKRAVVRRRPPDTQAVGSRTGRPIGSYRAHAAFVVQVLRGGMMRPTYRIDDIPAKAQLPFTSRPPDSATADGRFALCCMATRGRISKSSITSFRRNRMSGSCRTLLAMQSGSDTARARDNRTWRSGPWL